MALSLSSAPVDVRSYESAISFEYHAYLYKPGCSEEHRNQGASAEGFSPGPETSDHSCGLKSNGNIRHTSLLSISRCTSLLLPTFYPAPLHIPPHFPVTTPLASLSSTFFPLSNSLLATSTQPTTNIGYRGIMLRGNHGALTGLTKAVTFSAYPGSHLASAVAADLHSKPAHSNLELWVSMG